MSFAKNKLLNCFISCGCRKPKPSHPTTQQRDQNPKLSSPSNSSQRPPFTFSHGKALFSAPIFLDNGERQEEEEDDDDSNGYTTHPTPSNDHNGEFNFEVEPRKSMRVVSPCRKITNSIAFVKDSDDPFRDFKRSMLQMIFEREIRSKDDYDQLLNCFLQLNPPSQHHLIILAFTEIWNSVFLNNNTTANKPLDNFPA